MPKSYIQNLKDKYPAIQLKAYLNGEFVNLKGNTVYESFDRELNNTKLIINKNDKLHVGMDFNVGKMSAVICVIKDNILYVLDEVFGVLDTPAMIKEINKRYYGYDITVYPDASGRNKKSSDASKTDISLLKEYFVVKARSKNPLVKDRVMSVQSLILNMNGVRRLYVNTKKCLNLVDNLEQQIYNEKGEPDKSSGKDHMLDALGYCVYWNFPLAIKSLKIVNSPF